MSQRHERARWWSGGYDVILVFVIIGLMYAQVMTSLAAYLFGRAPTTDDIVQYWLVASGTLVLSLAGVVIAVVRRKVAPALCFSLFFLALVCVALVLSVPRIDLTRDTPPLNENYVPCYSGSNDCPGG